MKFKFPALLLLTLLAANLFAQKPVTADVSALNLHLSSYRDLDADIQRLVADGFKPVEALTAKRWAPLKTIAYMHEKDSIDNIIEIIYSEDKKVYRVNLYYGFSPSKWSIFTDSQKSNVATNLFLNVRDLINKEYEASEKGQRKVWGNYKATDYEEPATLLKGFDDRDLGYFVSWGPFGKYPIELETHSARYIVVSVADPEGITAYYTKK